MGKSPASINLLQHKRSNADVFLQWALTTGRFIIIITETIALAAFLYRFTLDSQIINLHDKIKQKQALITYYKDNETKYRLLQRKLTTLSSLEAQSPEVPVLVNKIISIAEGKVVFDNLTITAKDALMTANTTSITLMNNFVTSLKQDPSFAAVSVNQVESEPDTGKIGMSITVTFAKKKGVINAS